MTNPLDQTVYNIITLQNSIGTTVYTFSFGGAFVLLLNGQGQKLINNLYNPNAPSGAITKVTINFCALSQVIKILIQFVDGTNDIASVQQSAADINSITKYQVYIGKVLISSSTMCNPGSGLPITKTIPTAKVKECIWNTLYCNEMC